MQGLALPGLLVVEMGDRIATGSCGTLLADAGADVVLIEPPGGGAGAHKWRDRAVAAAGKLSLALDPGKAADVETFRRVVARADVVLLSSDVASPWAAHVTGLDAECQIVCDVTAFGGDAPADRQGWPDELVQAISGTVDVTGQPDAPPTPVGLPVLEMTAALYASAGVVAALTEQRASGRGQRVEVSLYDCGVNALATFLPLHFGGKVARRAGNRHTMCSPWNAFKAADGWVLICSATDDQWRRLCTVMGREDIAAAAGLATLKERVENVDRVDAIVNAWTGARSMDACMAALGASGIVCGPIVAIDQLAGEPNIKLRQAIAELSDPLTGRKVAIAQAPLALSGLSRSTSAIPLPDAGRAEVLARLDSPSRHHNRPPASRGGGARPLAGIRVLEIGQYTTAPLCAKHLASLGADVLKIEPTTGESSRFWSPHQGGQGYFFTMSNSDKRSVVVDLATSDGQALFRKLAAGADVLLENTKPGSLRRRGFGPEDFAAINPRLVYCSISGFGYRTAYPLRPAMDTVSQAMSGIMDATRSGGMPVKAGISASDIVGGQFALLAILLALYRRAETGRGADIDLCMQDCGAWCTRLNWNGKAGAGGYTVVAATDGHVVAEATAAQVERVLGATAGRREGVSARLKAAGIPAAPVRTVAEVAAAPETAARELVPWVQSGDLRWPLLGSPIRLSRTPAVVATPIAALGSANAAIEQELAAMH